jgi:FkbM family methyltransferase
VATDDPFRESAGAGPHPRLMDLEDFFEAIRVRAVCRLGGVLPQRGLTYPELVQLLYPGLKDPVIRQIVDTAAEGELTDPSTIRRMLGAVEHQLAPTSFSVQLTRDDVSLVRVGDIELFCDTADRSVSLTLQAGDYEPHLTSVFKRFCQPGMTVVDIGANIGYYSILASELVGPQGQVVAIEPNSENCRLLVSSMRLTGRTNITLLPVACDDRTGWAYYSTHIGSNGGLVDKEDLLASPGTVVPTFKLDDLVDAPVGMLKMDVEGAEARVVAGARKLIERHRPVITTELSEAMLEEVSGATPSEYLNYFHGLGYSLAVIDRESGEPRRYPTVRSLLLDWREHYQIEDLLLLPDDSPAP